MFRGLGQINIIAHCRELRWTLWSCPPFLFLLMGIVTIVAMLGTYAIALHYVDEQGVIVLVSGVTAILLVIGTLAIRGFNTVAESDRMKTEFISIVSHQLRSPLSIFKWTVDMLEHDEKKRGDDKGRLTDSLRTLRDATENMIQLVNMLLEVSRMEAGTLMLRNAAFSLTDLTADIVENYGSYARASQVSFQFAPPSDLPSVYADRERMTLVIQNLIANAIHYHAPGPSSITITISRAGRLLRWEIRDTGVGIPLAEQAHVFQKFYRSAGALKRQTRGTGVGLYVTRGIIDASGGAIGFRSREGEGTTFWFTLPVEGDTKA